MCWSGPRPWSSRRVNCAGRAERCGLHDGHLSPWFPRCSTFGWKRWSRKRISEKRYGRPFWRERGVWVPLLNIAEELERAAYEKCSMRTREAGVGLVHFLSAQAAALADCSVLTAPENGDEADHEPSLALLGQKSLPSSGFPGQERYPKTSWFRKVQAFFHHP